MKYFFLIAFLLILGYAIFNYFTNKVVVSFIQSEPEWKQLETRGNQLFYSRQYAEANVIYQQAIEQGKLQLQTDVNKNLFLLQIFNMDAICSNKIGKLDDAKMKLEEVIKLAEGMERPDQIGLKNYWLSSARIDKGLILIRNGNTTAADDVLTAALDTLPKAKPIDASLCKKLQIVIDHFEKAGNEKEAALFKKYMPNKAAAAGLR